MPRPWWGSQYRCHGGGPADGALRVRECCTGFVDHTRPAPGGESLGRRGHQIRVGDQLRRALHHYVVPLRREGDRTPRVTLEVSALACGTAGHDPVRAVVPSCPDTGDVRAAVGIDRGEPGRVPARTAVRIPALPLGQRGRGGVPVEGRETIELRKVLRLGAMTPAERKFETGNAIGCSDARMASTARRPQGDWRIASHRVSVGMSVRRGLAASSST
jgi:hypothetical protein